MCMYVRMYVWTFSTVKATGPNSEQIDLKFLGYVEGDQKRMSYFGVIQADQQFYMVQMDFEWAGDEFYNDIPWNLNIISVKKYLPIKFSQKNFSIFFMLSKFLWFMMNSDMFELRLVELINFHGILISFQSINIQKYPFEKKLVFLGKK